MLDSIESVTKAGEDAVAHWLDGKGELPKDLPSPEDASIWMWEAVWYELIYRAETPSESLWGNTPKRTLPRPDLIYKFWSPVLSYLRWGAKWNYRTQCWSCGASPRNGLERAHILPVNAYGSDASENVHLLCSVCHKISEPLHGRVYYEWLWSSMSHFSSEGFSPLPIESVLYYKDKLTPPRTRGFDIIPEKDAQEFLAYAETRISALN